MENGILLPITDCKLYHSDICIFCERSVKNLTLGLDYVTIDLAYLRLNSKIIPKCLTENEFAIKKILE